MTISAVSYEAFQKAMDILRKDPLEYLIAQPSTLEALDRWIRNTADRPNLQSMFMQARKIVQNTELPMRDKIQQLENLDEGRVAFTLVKKLYPHDEIIVAFRMLRAEKAKELNAAGKSGDKSGMQDLMPDMVAMLKLWMQQYPGSLETVKSMLVKVGDRYYDALPEEELSAVAAFQQAAQNLTQDVAKRRADTPTVANDLLSRAETYEAIYADMRRKRKAEKILEELQSKLSEKRKHTQHPEKKAVLEELDKQLGGCADAFRRGLGSCDEILQAYQPELQKAVQQLTKYPVLQQLAQDIWDGLRSVFSALPDLQIASDVVNQSRMLRASGNEFPPRPRTGVRSAPKTPQSLPGETELASISGSGRR